MYVYHILGKTNAIRAPSDISMQLDGNSEEGTWYGFYYFYNCGNLLRFNRRLLNILRSQRSKFLLCMEQRKSGRHPPYLFLRWRRLCPVVEFWANGQIIRAKAQTQKGVTRNRVPCQMGDSIQIRYNPDRPQSFIIPGYDVNMKVILGIGSLAAAIILILAVCILFVPQ